MQKIYGGPRLRRLREERGLTQLALARILDLSASYVNQLENDQRPLTVPVLLKLNATFDLDVHFFAADSDARLAADLQDVLTTLGTPTPPASTIEEFVARMPEIGHALVGVHRRLQAATEQVEQLSAHLDTTSGAGAPGATPMPFEEVRDFFYDRHNHIAELDDAAERLFVRSGLRIGSLDTQLTTLLESEYDVIVRLRTDPPDRPGPKRVFDTANRILTLARHLSPGQRAFQIATQLAFLTQSTVIDRQVDAAAALGRNARELAKIGLANYFAGALLLPYSQFLDAAEHLHYDIEMLALQFEVGFETVCHRLSTMQRPTRRGVPFFFVRTDRAGNISKRQSATAFHFSRVGGSCPLWVVHDAFGTPGRILTQVAQMPDGRTYLWIARTTDDGARPYGTPDRSFAVGLGCDITHADRLVYSRGLRLDEQVSPVPIGAGCKICERTDCVQRAFPQIGRPIRVDVDFSSRLPYPPAS
ncbi:short-chain fatty acyl-CoA regulator family protein [Rhodococcus sp. SGAir0479]|uniref:short-chain fatty acyl-CoA regulator family protein n=1 Tax=Rhodococcus sp. SGAir0479 TaxID=2567884 RepID=UPI0010CD59C6|nr:short-chain fatty acyl-CoA regulator family protein [Rhodococcus sp. SGAir0479]QCQ89860.1 XRE family transcriptional regulator [Rhodococcus sp. SGAir0479]